MEADIVAEPAHDPTQSFTINPADPISGRSRALEERMLVVLGGLPATGKTTLGKALAVRLSAAYVRVDEIEHALTHHAKLGPEIGVAGYVVAFAVAASNLRLGGLVIADSVNPVPESRQGWRDVAGGEAAHLLEIEVICSDEVEHRRRIKTRTADIAGFKLPSWSSVVGRDYVPWTSPRLVVDTALLTRDEAVAAIEAAIDGLSRGAPSTLLSRRFASFPIRTGRCRPKAVVLPNVQLPISSRFVDPQLMISMYTVVQSYKKTY